MTSEIITDDLGILRHFYHYPFTSQEIVLANLKVSLNQYLTVMSAGGILIGLRRICSLNQSTEHDHWWTNNVRFSMWIIVYYSYCMLCIILAYSLPPTFTTAHLLHYAGVKIRRFLEWTLRPGPPLSYSASTILATLRFKIKVPFLQCLFNRKSSLLQGKSLSWIQFPFTQMKCPFVGKTWPFLEKLPFLLRKIQFFDLAPLP